MKVTKCDLRPDRRHKAAGHSRLLALCCLLGSCVASCDAGGLGGTDDDAVKLMLAPAGFDPLAPSPRPVPGIPLDAIDPAAGLKDVGDLCPRLPGRKIDIEEPTMLGRYDLDTLGIIDVSVSPDTKDTCIAAALSDGAEILAVNAERVRFFYPTRLEMYLDAARERIDMPAVEGRWSWSARRAVPGRSGRSLDVAASKAAIIKAVGYGADAVSLVVSDLPALSADLSSVEGFRPTVLLGSYSTVFSKARNRTVNVRLAAAAMDGVFLMPGAEFSYNAWVGERTEARGFMEAPVIVNGETVEGLGGGACQVSSTVHAAALMSGLDVVERYNHSLPSTYIPKGLDAVVSWPGLDLRVRNNFDRPVVLKVTAGADNKLVAGFYSDRHREGSVRFRSTVLEEIPYPDNVTVDPGLAPGDVVVRRAGKPGYRIGRSLIVSEGGTEREIKLSPDTYKSQTRQLLIAPGVKYVPGMAPNTGG